MLNSFKEKYAQVIALTNGMLNAKHLPELDSVVDALIESVKNHDPGIYVSNEGKTTDCIYLKANKCMWYIFVEGPNKYCPTLWTTIDINPKDYPHVLKAQLAVDRMNARIQAERNNKVRPSYWKCRAFYEFIYKPLFQNAIQNVEGRRDRRLSS